MKNTIFVILALLFAVGETTTAQSSGGSIQWGQLKIGESRYYFSGFSDPANVKTIVGKDTTTKLAPYSAVMVFTLLQAWDEYLAWCADSVQKRGFDRIVARAAPKDSLVTENQRVFYFAKTEPTYYRAPREPMPTFYGFIEWLRQRVK